MTDSLKEFKKAINKLIEGLFVALVRNIVF